jgi:hypothetical protein
MPRATVPSDQISRKRWDICTTALQLIQQQVNKGSLDMNKLKIEEDNEGLHFIYEDDK